MTSIDWGPLFLTLRLAATTTVVLAVVGIPLALWLASTRSRIRPIVETIVSLPLVLPPSVLGFYLLLAFTPERWLGRWLRDWFDLSLVFSFEGLVVGSALFSLPFMVHPVQSGLAALPTSLREAAYTLGKSRFETSWRVLLPNVRPSLLAGTVLAFAHTVGEFGVVLMIGGNIPGVTRVASIAIYDEVEALDHRAAHAHALVLVGLSFAVLLFVYLLRDRLGARAAALPGARSAGR